MVKKISLYLTEYYTLKVKILSRKSWKLWFKLILLRIKLKIEKLALVAYIIWGILILYLRYELYWLQEQQDTSN